MPHRAKYALMSQKDKNLLSFICLSSAIIYFDFLIYLYIADTVAVAFFPASIDPDVDKILGLGLFAVGYLARPLGGIILGRIGDVRGRKPVLLMSIVVTAISLLAMACLPTYAQWGLFAPALFIILRLIQGMAFGIFVPLSWTYTAEHISREHLSIGCSYVTASFFVGVLFSNAFFMWLDSSMSRAEMIDQGWRVPFFVAAVLSTLPLLAWRYVKESPLFLAMVEAKRDQPNEQPLTLLFKYCKQSLFVAMMLTFVIASLVIVIVLLLPDLIELRFDLDSDLFAFGHSIGIIFIVLGCIFYGLLANYQNFGKILAAGSILLIVQTFAFYYHLQAGGDYILFMYALLGFFAGIVGMVPAIFVRLFETNVRLTGLGFAYNITYAIVGGLMPFALGYATMFVSFSPALYIAFVGAIGVIMGLYFNNLPEFKQIDDVI